MSEADNKIADKAQAALDDADVMVEVLEGLEGASRRQRQSSASVLAVAARVDAGAVSGHAGVLVEALDKPEAQTRWEALDALTSVAAVDSDACDAALPGAEEALFDENNGMVRLAAVRFLCKYGSLDEARSAKVWPMIDEAIQCYHGDPEFLDMLLGVVEFAEGELDDGVKQGLRERMSFDAERSKGALGKRARQIVDALD